MHYGRMILLRIWNKKQGGGAAMNTYGANAKCHAIGISNAIVLMTLL